MPGSLLYKEVLLTELREIDLLDLSTLLSK